MNLPKPPCLLVQRETLSTLVGTHHLEVANGAPFEVCGDNRRAIIATHWAFVVLGHALLPAALTKKVGATLMRHGSTGDQQANGTLESLHVLLSTPFLIISTHDLSLLRISYVLISGFPTCCRHRRDAARHAHQVHSAQGCQGCDESLKLCWIKPVALHSLDCDGPGGGRKSQPSCAVHRASRPIEILMALRYGHSVTLLKISPSSDGKLWCCTVVGVNLHPLIWWCWGIILRTIVLSLLHVLLIIQSPHARGKVDDRVTANLRHVGLSSKTKTQTAESHVRCTKKEVFYCV